MSPIVESSQDPNVINIDNDPQHDDQIAPTQIATPPYTRTSFFSFLSLSDIPLFRARYNMVCPRFVALQFMPRYVLLSFPILFHNSFTLAPVASFLSVDNNPRTCSASFSPLFHLFLISVTAPSPNPHKRDQSDTGYSPGLSPPVTSFSLLLSDRTVIFFYCHRSYFVGPLSLI